MTHRVVRIGPAAAIAAGASQAFSTRASRTLKASYVGLKRALPPELLRLLIACLVVLAAAFLMCSAFDLPAPGADFAAQVD